MFVIARGDVAPFNIATQCAIFFLTLSLDFVFDALFFFLRIGAPRFDD